MPGIMPGMTTKKRKGVQQPLIPAHSRLKDGVLPHAYAGIQGHT